MEGTESELARTNAVKLYSQTIELDKELRSLLKKKNPFDKSVISIRNNIRQNYENLLFLDYDFAQSKDIEQFLWKIVFYKVIEEFRKRIRKFVALSQKNDRTAKEELQKVCDSFNGFLANASRFYLELIQKFQLKYNLKLDGTVDVPYEPEEGHLSLLHPSYLSVHRCYIFLGDLARYHKDLFGHPSQKDWSKATYYYYQAIQLAPDYGNSHNQLAVVATYSDDEFNSVYQYFRSLSVAHPFQTAKENLMVLFDKNKQKIEDEGVDEQQNRPLKKFSSYFVWFQGALFSRRGIEQLEDVKNELLSNFDFNLSNGHINDLFILKMLVINIVSLLNISNPTQSSQTPPLAEKEKNFCSNLLICFCFDIISRLTKIPVKENPFLSSISFFFEFLRFYPQYSKKFIADFSRTLYLPFWKQFVVFLNQLDENDVSDAPEGVLPEEVELRGFFPLHQVYRNLRMGKVLEEKEANKKRAGKIFTFGLQIAAFPETPKMLSFSRENRRFFSETSQNSQQAKRIPAEPQKELLELDDEVIVWRPSPATPIGGHLSPSAPPPPQPLNHIPTAVTTVSPLTPTYPPLPTNPTLTTTTATTTSNETHSPTTYRFFGGPSFFPVQNPEDPMRMQPIPPIGPPGPLAWLQAESHSNWQFVPPSLFPFPGQQPIRYQTKNPFIS